MVGFQIPTVLEFNLFGIQNVAVFNLRGPAKKSSSLKSLLPLRVKPNPLDLHFFLQRMYSLKPPGPAHTSAKYNNGFSLFTIGEPSVYPVDKAILFRAGVLNLFHLYTLLGTSYSLGTLRIFCVSPGYKFSNIIML